MENLVQTKKDIDKLRRNLAIAIVLFIVIAITSCIYFNLSQAVSNASAVQQTKSSVERPIGTDNKDDKEDNKTEKTATIPDLVALIGSNVDSLSDSVGHGAQILSDEKKEGDEGGVERIVKFTLSNDKGDSKTGNPTITVNLDGEGNVLDVTYVASIKTLGYGTLSFRDAILNAKIITKVMDEAGVSIDEADVNLPSDRTEYSFFSEDSKRVVKEQRTFSGEGKKSGGGDEKFSWSATLTYDYSASIENDNLEDTIRKISIAVARG